MRDVRYAVRSLRRQPLFTLVAVLTLAVGIGANTAIFSLLYRTLLRPLPYPDADRLVFVWNSYPLMGLPQASVSIPDFIDRTTQAPALEDATLFAQRSVSLAEGARPEQVRALRVTPSFFSTFGRTPMLGRAFGEQEAQPGSDQFAILTHGLWISRFGGDRTIVGRDIRLDGVPHEVMGVLPPDFELPARDVALLVPFAFTPQDTSDESRGFEFSAMIARLAPGATVAQLETQMATIIERNLQRLPQFRSFAETSGFSGIAIPIREQLVGDVRTPLLILQAGVLLVLLIACANVANLLLMRATGRHREIAIRTAIGAGRGHVIRQLLTEGLVLSVAGAAVGLGLAVAGARALAALLEPQLPEQSAAVLNLPLLGFALALTALTGLVFGLVPASSMLRASVLTGLRGDGARGATASGTGLTRTALVIAEVGLAVMLLIGAGLLMRSYARLQQVDPGFSSENVITAQLSLPAARYPEAGDRVGFWTRLLDDVRRVPGVTAAGLTSNVPFNGMVSSGSYRIVGYTPPEGEAAPHARQEVVGGDYFHALQIPLVAGRLFQPTDLPDGQPVVVVDEYLVSRYFRDKDPIGQQIQRGGSDSPPFTIVGVVGTINSIDLGEPVTKERIYYPITQQPRPAMALVVKTALDPQTLVGPIRAAVEAIDPEQPLADVRTLDQWVGRSLQTRRASTLLVSLFGGIALLLAGIGIYGVLAFGVAQREREFAIRQALGADGRTILRLVMSHGVRTTAVGIGVGVAGAFGLTRFLESQLFGIGTRDPLVFAGAPLLLLGIALLASYLPARASTRVDPIVALREG